MTGRVLAGMSGVGLMIVGIALTMTVAGAPVGVPFAILGLLLMTRNNFQEMTLQNGDYFLAIFTPDWREDKFPDVR